MMWIRSNHPWSYGSGRWLLLHGLTVANGRVCWDVEWIGGPGLGRDAWPVEDSSTPIGRHLFFHVGDEAPSGSYTPQVTG